MAERVEIQFVGSDGVTRPAQNVTKALGGLDAAAKAASKNLAAMASGLSSLGTKMTIGITLPVVAAAGALTKMAMDAVESENLFEVSMGGMATAARDFSVQLRDQFGLNSFETRRMIGTWNTMLGSMGMTKDGAFEMSKSLTMLANDMASFYNMSPELAFSKLQAGISGEIEPLKRLGIVINETTVKNWALTEGLIEQGQELSESQKVMARYALIMQQTGKAQGDLARTIESPANQLRVLKSRLTEAATEAGQVFLPAVSAALLWVNQEGVPRAREAIEKLGDSWAEMSEQARNRIIITAGLLVAGGPLLKAIAVGIQAVGLLANAFGIIPIKARLAIAGAVGALFVFRDKYADFMESNARITLRFGELLQKLPGMAGAAFETMKAGMGLMEMSQNIRSLGVDVGELATNVVTTLDPAFTALTDRVMELGQDGLAALGSLTDSAEQNAARQGRLWADFATGTRQAALDVHDAGTAAGFAIDNFKGLAPAVDEAAEPLKKVKEQAEAAAVSLGQLSAAMAAQHPATLAAASAVQTWQQRIASVNLALVANQDQMRAAQRDLQGMQEHLSGLNAQLSEARQRFAELTSPRLLGMGKFDTQITTLQDQIRKLEISKLTISMGGGDTSAVEAQLRALQDKLRLTELTKEDTFAVPLRQLKEAAEGTAKELTFTQALAGIRDTKAQIADLTGAIAGQEAAIRGQQSAINSIQAASEALNRTLAEYQNQLKAAEANQNLVTDALRLAFQWFVDDRQKVRELGGEAVDVANVMDKKTTALLAAITKAAADTTGTSQATLAAMVASYQRDMLTATIEVGKLQGALDDIPRQIVTEHLTIHRDIFESAGGSVVPEVGGAMGGAFRVPNFAGTPGFAMGGAFAVGGLPGIDSVGVAFRAKPGEIVNIQQPGQEILPRYMAAAPVINVTVNVDGNVIQERDLATTVVEALRQTSIAKYDLGEQIRAHLIRQDRRGAGLT